MVMTRLNRLSVKLPLFVAASIIIVATILSTLNVSQSQSALREQASSRLDHIATTDRDNVQDWYANLQNTVQIFANSDSAAAALDNFSKNFARGEEPNRQAIRDAYVSGSPFPAGERDQLLRGEGVSFYHTVHEQRHGEFKKFNSLNMFYDTFLVSPNGDIVYSVFKESDFGQNVLEGDLAGSGIGVAFRLSLNDPAEVTHFSGFDTYAPSNGAVAAFASARILDESGELAGVAIVQLNLSEFAAMFVIDDSLGATTEAFIVSEEGRILVPSRFEGSAEKFDAIPLTDHIAQAIAGTKSEAFDAVGLSNASVSTVAVPVELDRRRYGIVVEQSNDEIRAEVIAQRNMSILISVALAAVISLAAWFYIWRITTSLEGLREQMGQIAHGDFNVELTSMARSDEIGDIGRTLEDFRTKLHIAEQQSQERELGQIEQQKVLEVLTSGLRDLAEGDLTKPIETTFDPQYENIRLSFNETLKTLSDAISSVVVAAGSIKNGTTEISQASDDLSNRTENQAATLEQTAAALDELTASVKSASEGANSVTSIVSEAQTEAEASGVIVGDAIAAMTEIEKSSEHISQIIGVIDDIAFQTNLLALNAGVEAARAGEAGKGFAVVASEVRALAQRSSEAAKEIKTLISGSEKQVERGVELVGGAGTALQNIVERVTHISELIRSMAKGSEEQSIGLNEINIGVNQLDQVTQQNAAMVEEATAASHVLKSDVYQLQDLVSRFRVSNDGASTPSANSSNSSVAVVPVQFKRAERAAAFEPEPMQMAVGDDRPTGGTVESSGSDWVDF